jgi:dienelactone hydrolase
MIRPVLGWLLLLLLVPLARGEDPAVEKGTVHFTPGDQAKTPERYRLEARDFPYETALKFELPALDVDVYHLRFPSPVKSPHAENNTVHAEYYRPRQKGPFPGVIVLDITGGDQSLSRCIATQLAQKGIAGLFVQMAYYGPRRPPNSKLRLLSTDLHQTTEAVRQTVLDLRCAAAWLASRPEIDAERLGIMGTSLGSLVGTLTAEMEPRFRRVAILLGGGGLVDAFWDDPRAKFYRDAYELFGGTKEKVAKFIAPLDPLTCAANLKDRKLLIMAGQRDEILPPRMAEALWKASGRQKIVWFDCTHYGGVLYLAVGLENLVEHFGAP